MKKFMPAIALCSVAVFSQAAPAVIALRPEGVPGAKAIDAEVINNGSTSNVSEPTLSVYAPAVDKPNGTAVFLCPGGGYVRLSTGRQGVQYANWLGTLGVTSFVLKSRLSRFGHPAPLQDVLRPVPKNANGRGDCTATL